MRVWVFALLTTWAATAEAARILVVKRQEPMFDQAFQVMTQTLGKDHTVEAYDVEKNTDFGEFQTKIRSAKPDLMLLLDNRPVNHAMTLAATAGDPFAGTKAVASFALNLKKQLAGHRTIAGIAYEVPALTIMTQFRYLIGRPLNNVLVIYRKSEFEATIAEAREQLKSENIKLIALDAEANGRGKREIETFLDEHLTETMNQTPIDAVWVVADNALINRDTLNSIWLKRAKTFKVPFLCGVEALVARSLDFCTFAAAPNPIDLADQMVEMSLAILDDGNEPGDLGIKYLVSVVKILDLTKAEKLGFTIAPDRLGDVKVVK